MPFGYARHIRRDEEDIATRIPSNMVVAPQVLRYGRKA